MERYLVIGLGNPGRKYAGTRHNIGFHTVEELAESYRMSFDNKQAKALTADGMIKGQRVLIAKPQTFMNASGEAVRSLVDFYKISVENILVIYDDLDIDLGVLRIRSQGGSGGHNGIKSMINHLGSRDFSRIRFGIGRPPGRMAPSAYVLRPFLEEERPLVIETMNRAVRAVETWLTDGIDVAMNKYNGTVEDVAERQRTAEQNSSSENADRDPNTN